MNLVVLTPEKELFSGTIQAVKVPGIGGQFEVLKGHAPLVSALGNGIVYVTESAGSKHQFEIKQGFIEILNDDVAVLVS